MPDENEDQGNSQILEGGEEILSAIDSVLGENGEDVSKQGQQTTEKQAAETQQTVDKTAEAAAEAERVERARNEKGQFTKEQQEEKERVDKAAKEQQSAQGAKEEDLSNPTGKPTSKNFDFVKGQRDEQQRRAESAEAKLKLHEAKIQELEARSGTAAPEVKVLQRQVADLQSQLEDREKIISFKAVEETQAFREGVTAPQNEALEVLRQVSETYSLDSRKLEDVLQQPNKFKRLEMLGDLTADLPERSAFVKDELKQSVEKYVAAEGKAKQLFENAKGSRDYAEQEKQQTEAKAALDRQQAYQKANQEVEGILKEKFPEIAGDSAKWSEIIEKASKVADFDRMPPKAKAFANVASWMIMPLMEKYRAEVAEHQKTKDLMAKRNGAVPSAGGGRAAVGQQQGDEDNRSLLDVLDEQFAGV